MSIGSMPQSAGYCSLSALGAVRNGATREVLRIAALIMGIFLAMWWYDRVALQLQPYIDEPRLAACAAFLLIFAGCLIARRRLCLGLSSRFGALSGCAGSTGCSGPRSAWFAACSSRRGFCSPSSPSVRSPAPRRRLRSRSWRLGCSTRPAPRRPRPPQDFQETFTDGFDRVREVWTGSRSQPDADLL